MENILSEVFGIWFLIGAAFVFFMQAGFAMVETGFTRAKNAGNIIMKNLMDFCIGTVVFMFLGFGILLGEDALGGFIGIPTLGIITDYANFDWSNFVFNLVFCATTATIVSGAMGAFFVGVVSGLLVCFGVWFCDYVIRVDDPVGAVAVHFCNGLWGTIAVGLFATTSAPSCEINGLFYGGGTHQLLLQLTGVGSVLLWTGVTMFIVFKVIDKIFGLRVTDQEQLDGLDIHEHGMNAYYGFRIDK